jgi:two-component system, NtrC family, nitrogen regulation sensor histidine kinase NtrY
VPYATRGRGALVIWAAGTGLAVLALAGWLRSPEKGYLVAALVATIVAAVGVARMLPGRRLWPLFGVATLALGAIAGSAAQWRLWQLENSADRFEAAAVARASAAFSAEIERAVDDLVRIANRSLEAPVDAQGAFRFVESLARGQRETSVVLYRDGVPFAWSGRSRVDPAELRGEVGLGSSPFHQILYARAVDGASTAVAMLLLQAVPPADGLSRPLEREIADGTGVRGFEMFAVGAEPTDAEPVVIDGRTLFHVRSVPERVDQVRFNTIESARLRGTILLALSIATLLAVIWRRQSSLRSRFAVLAIAATSLALVPLNAFSNRTRWFDPSIYFASLGGPFSANAGTLTLSAALLFLGLLLVLRAPVRLQSRAGALVLVVAIAGIGPFLLRDLARGISPPMLGVSTGLWLGWQVPLFLVALSILLAGATAGRALVRRGGGLPTTVAPLVAIAAAAVGPIAWDAPGRWPDWYSLAWVAAIGVLALTRRASGFLLATATVASLGAATLVWGTAARQRVLLAESDVAGLMVADPVAHMLLERFGLVLCHDDEPPSRAGMLRRYVASDLAAANYPAEMTGWGPDLVPVATLSMSQLNVDQNEVRAAIAEAIRLGGPVQRTTMGATGLNLVLAVPHASGGATSVVIAPRTRLIPDEPFLGLIGVGAAVSSDPPYTISITPADERSPPETERPHWERAGNELHGDWTLVGTDSPRLRAHVEVELRGYGELVQRGGLVLLLNLAIVGVLWVLTTAADGGLGRWIRRRYRKWASSYRARLTLALFGFFVLPAAIFAAWSYQGLRAGDRQSRELLVRETLRAAAQEVAGGQLDSASVRLRTPLLLYTNGQLSEASDPLYASLAPLGRFVPPEVQQDLVLGDEITASREERVGDVNTLVGYRALGTGMERGVLAAPARTDEVALDRRRRDLGILVLFATAVGALAALWASGVAGREFARPISELRGAAIAVARGEREPALGGTPPEEFGPVFSAFRSMATDLSESREAVEVAQRRTAAILRNVASGVVAVDSAGYVTLANPRADALLGVPLPPGTPLSAVNAPVLERSVDAFLQSAMEEEEFEIEIDGRQLHGRLTRLTRGSSGAVVTLDDVSELARAQRVLAWGEMARQVAHEIKNPLTPIRLGVQHLRRARAAGRPDFDAILEQNVDRILAEIDRLDEIARAFSRYGTAPSQAAPREEVDVGAVVLDVVELERLGAEAGSVEWNVTGATSGMVALARAPELREVLLNLLENARLAGARSVEVSLSGDDETIVLTVSDDGDGIPEALLTRIFEPHFSTRTSGSGLGLAVSRRLIEGWGGTITAESTVTEGTRMELRLLRPFNRS